MVRKGSSVRVRQRAFSMVRKGSSVRVRQRAFRCARRSGATSPTSALSFHADAWPPAPGAARPNLNRSDTTPAAGRSGTAAQTDDRAAVGHVGAAERPAEAGGSKLEWYVGPQTISRFGRRSARTGRLNCPPSWEPIQCLPRRRDRWIDRTRQVDRQDATGGSAGRDRRVGRARQADRQDATDGSTRRNHTADRWSFIESP